jgi:hypothetical protein
MSALWMIDIGKQSSSEFEKYARMMLKGDEFASDIWVFHQLGVGSGDWKRSASTKSITLYNNDVHTIAAVLHYEQWPLRKGSTGRVTLTQPLRGARTSETQLEFRVHGTSGHMPYH